MITAISMRHRKADHGYVDSLENSYIQYYEKFGLTIIPIPNVSNNVDDYFEKMKISGIILTGGDDVEPSLYKGKNLGENYSRERDRTEAALIRVSINRKIPLLATCRGTQMLNVFFGGKIIQKIDEISGVRHVATRHRVKIIDPKAIKLYRKKEFFVNSFHNHGVDKNSISKKLRSFALSEDGITEGIYHPEYPMAGILWHPERKGSDSLADEKFVKAFIERKFFWDK